MVDISIVAAILCALQDTGGSPESMLYIFCDMNMDKWMSLRNVLVSAGLISIKGHYVTLTPKGQENATRINDALKRHEATL